MKFLQETEKEKDGYMKSVKSLLLACENDSNLNKGVYGALANLISTNKEYETAIEMCLGATMQNIVTQEENDAKRLIEYLRKNNLGRASFLPISAIHGRKLEKINNHGINGVIGIASDLVKCDKKYNDIVLNLLGRTVIVENMDSAIALAKLNNYSFKIVTIQGDIINPSGAMSGGSVAQKTVNILGRGREIEEITENLNTLQKQINTISKEKEEFSTSITDTIENAAALEKDLQDIEIKYATEKQKVEMIDASVLKLEQKFGKSKKRTRKYHEAERRDYSWKSGNRTSFKEYRKRNFRVECRNYKFCRIK